MRTNTNLANVIPFYKEKDDLRIVDPIKFITKVPVSTRMECLYNEKQILAVYNVLLSKVENARTVNKEKVAMRNLTMFICAINIGLRGGDFCKLRWHQVFDENWKCKEKESFVPEKTTRRDANGNIIKRKYIILRYDSDFKMAMNNWLNWLVNHNLNPEFDDYIFSSNKNECVMEKSWYTIIEKTRKEANIVQKIGTHGLRKTYGHSYYLASSDKSQALVQLMQIFGHSDMRITLAYICISDEEIFSNQENMCIFSKEGKDQQPIFDNIEVEEVVG